jgi:hypothetical protein
VPDRRSHYVDRLEQPGKVQDVPPALPIRRAREEGCVSRNVALGVPLVDPLIDDAVRSIRVHEVRHGLLDHPRCAQLTGHDRGEESAHLAEAANYPLAATLRGGQADVLSPKRHLNVPGPGLALVHYDLYTQKVVRRVHRFVLPVSGALCHEMSFGTRSRRDIRELLGFSLFCSGDGPRVAT